MKKENCGHEVYIKVVTQIIHSWFSDLTLERLEVLMSDVKCSRYFYLFTVCFLVQVFVTAHDAHILTCS